MENNTSSARRKITLPEGRRIGLDQILVAHISSTLDTAGAHELVRKVQSAAAKLVRSVYHATLDEHDDKWYDHGSATVHNHLDRTRRLVRIHGAEPPVVREAKLHIWDAYPMKGMSLSTVADANAVSKEHLARIFRHSEDITVLEYIAHLRIGDSMIRIARGEPLKAVAIDVGYGSYNSFLRSFQGFVGKSPSKVLEEMRAHGTYRPQG